MIFYMALMTAVQYRSYKKEFKPEYKMVEGRPLVLLKNLGNKNYL